MGDTIELVLRSEHGEDVVELPAETWAMFEEMAREQGWTPEEVLTMIIKRFMEDPDFEKKVIKSIEEHEGSG